VYKICYCPMLTQNLNFARFLLKILSAELTQSAHHALIQSKAPFISLCSFSVRKICADLRIFGLFVRRAVGRCRVLARQVLRLGSLPITHEALLFSEWASCSPLKPRICTICCSICKAGHYTKISIEPTRRFHAIQIGSVEVTAAPLHLCCQYERLPQICALYV
jgi:hypothetical protein